jgi:hypothetical protein
VTDSNSFSITDGVNPPASASESTSVNSQNDVSTANDARVNPLRESVNLPRAVHLGANPVDGGHDRDEIERFIDELCYNAPGLIQTVRAEGKDLYPRFHTTGPDGISEAVTRLDNLSRACQENTGLYIQVTTCIENPNTDDQPEFLRFGRKRGGISNTSHLLCLWDDIDFGTTGHADAPEGRLPNPPDAETAHQIYLNSGLPEASVVVNSGGGLYDIVLLDEPFDLTVDGNRARAISVSRRWQQLIEKTAREMGYHYGAGVSNLDRILRVPGTVNTKQWDNKRRATALYNEDDGGIPRYSFDQLEALINDLHPEPVEPRTPDGQPYRVDRWAGAGSELPGNDFNARGDWQRDILDRAGFTYSHAQGQVTYWGRPGKDIRKGHGFSLNHKPDLLFAFTDGTALKQNRYYDKFSAFAHLFHGGDFKAAAAALRSMGYGSAPVPAPRREAPQTEEAPVADTVSATTAPPMTDSAAAPEATVTEDDELETRDAFAERMDRITDASVKKNEARKRVKQLARQKLNEEERQVERDFLKATCKLTAGDFKALYATAARDAAQTVPDGSDTRPLYVMGDELREYSNLVELIENGVFPETYVRDGKLVHVSPVSGVRAAKGKINTSTYQAKDIAPSTLRRLVATYTTPYRQTEKGADSPLPTRALCETVLDNSEWDGVDTLNGLTDAPFVRADGTICQDHGYDQATGMWLALPPGYRPVPDIPSAEDVSAAIGLLMSQVLKDFPFATTADRANAIGMLVTPMIRNIADCVVPLHLINAHTPGTGKTLLAKIAIAAHGGDAYTFPRNSDEELRKQVTSILMDQASPVVNFDNIATGSTLESPALAALITGSTWRDRLLGGNTTVALPNDKLWCATGNNLKVNTDLSQRSVLVHLDAGTERPDLRPAETFELGDLEQWLLKDENRAELVRALLILIRDWAVAGMPRSDHTMRSFTPWAQAVGGLLAHHGITGFLGNTDSVVEADEDKQQDALFLQKWTELLPDRWMSASDVITRYQVMEQQRWTSGEGMAIDKWQGSFPLRSNGKPFSAVGFGKWLGARKDTPIHGFVLRRRVDSDTNRSEWRVERIEHNDLVTAEQTEVFHPDRN